jgi:hypothetical protein
MSGRPDDSGELGRMFAVIGENVVELWQENAVTVEVFVSMITQWNVGPAGAIGLRYESLPIVFDSHGIAPEDRGGVFAGLRVMERAALESFKNG